MIQPVIYSKADIELLIKNKTNKIETEFYKELNKLRAMIINLDDLVKVIERNKK